MTTFSRSQIATSDAGGHKKDMAGEIVVVDQIEPLILTIRGQQVLLDSDLAGLYGVTTKALNQAVKRNRRRFPRDFMLRLTA